MGGDCHTHRVEHVPGHKTLPVRSVNFFPFSDCHTHMRKDTRPYSNAGEGTGKKAKLGRAPGRRLSWGGHREEG